MNWESPPLQSPGSMDCELFAASYIARALGYNTSWEDVRKWKEENRYAICRYPEMAHGAKPTWMVWGSNVSNDEVIDKWKLAHAHGNPDFRRWAQEFTESGHIGYASYHAGSREYNHAVGLLAADDEGVLLADSVHGLIQLPWKQFTDPYDNFRESALVWAWYKLK